MILWWLKLKIIILMGRKRKTELNGEYEIQNGVKIIKGNFYSYPSKWTTKLLLTPKC